MARLPLVSPLDRILFLKAQPYLEGQSPEVLIALASYSEEHFVPAGGLVRASAESLDRVLFLAEGAVEVLPPASEKRGSRFISAPGVIGLPHYFAKSTSIPEVRALEDTLCLSVATADMDQILEDHFPLLLRFSKRTAGEAEASMALLGAERPDEVGFEEPGHVTPAQLDVVDRLAIARMAPFFRHTSLTVLGRMIADDQIEVMSPGDVLWGPGDEIDRMVFVVDGEFVSDEPMPRRVPAGGVVGGLEILIDGQRIVGWTASATSRVISIDRERFVDVLEDHFDFSVDYLHYTATRILSAWAAVENDPRVERQRANA